VSETYPSNNSMAKAAENLNQKPTKSRVLLWLTIVLLVAISSGSAWLLWQQYQTLIHLQSDAAKETNENKAQREQLSSRLENALKLQRQALEASIGELTQRQTSTAERVQALSNLSRDDWKLTEVSFLLRMANQRILLEHETLNAIALAESANTVLSELESADLFAVRKTLTEEIQALKMVSKVDREGIYLQLLALTQQVDNLPLIEPLIAEDEDMLALNETTTATTFWQKTLNFGKKTLNKLSRYVRVRDQGRRIDAILPPEDQMYLKQNLRLMLEQAQTGLLREEQLVYQASLDKAQNWIRDYYPLNEQAEIVLNDIDQLKKNIVQQALPDFSGSAALMKDYIAQKDKLTIAKRGASEHGAVK
jgi:uroporphyrin-III C-methyltransferase